MKAKIGHTKEWWRIETHNIAGAPKIDVAASHNTWFELW